MSTLDKMLAERSLESRTCTEIQAEELRQEVALNKLRKELGMSQTDLAAAVDVKLPRVAGMEQPDNAARLSTLKRYVTALGGELNIDVTLPIGKKGALHL